jgi:hypothetical protein
MHVGSDSVKGSERIWRGIDAGRSPINHERLMDASRDRLSAAARSGIPLEELIAARIFDSPRDFLQWESQHAGIMRRITDAGGVVAQKSELLSVALALIHNKALFEYMRTGKVRNTDRFHLIKHFFRNSDYSKSVVSEHGNYIRSAASYMCSSHVGVNVMLDDVFDQPLLQYEQLYGDYFRVYCGAVIAPGRESSQCMEPLLGSLKRQVSDWRHALLALAHSNSGIWRTPSELERRRNQKPGDRGTP